MLRKERSLWTNKCLIIVQTIEEGREFISSSFFLFPFLHLSSSKEIQTPPRIRAFNFNSPIASVKRPNLPLLLICTSFYPRFFTYNAVLRVIFHPERYITEMEKKREATRRRFLPTGTNRPSTLPSPLPLVVPYGSRV